jgi:hypothetical protein
MLEPTGIGFSTAGPVVSTHKRGEP